MSQNGEPQRSGEHWRVNMPAVVGVVFVFLIGVVVWVVVDNTGDSDAAQAPSSVVTQSTQSPQQGASTTLPSPNTTTRAPMPSVPAEGSTPTSADPSTTTTSTTAVVVTAAPNANDGAVPGDLGVSGRPMQRPPCNGSFITLLASSIGESASAGGIAALLAQYDGSNYLRTDQTCSSLNPDVDGDPIYVVYLGPFAVDTDACAARANGPEGAYARQLSNELDPDHSVACP